MTTLAEISNKVKLYFRERGRIKRRKEEKRKRINTGAPI